MKRRSAIALTLAVASLATTALATPAVAAPTAPTAPAGSLAISYAVTGSTTVTRSALKVPFKPTAIANTVLPDGTLKSALPLAPVKVSYLAYGFLPTTATVVFTQVKPAVGKLTIADTGITISSTAQYVVSLRGVSFGGTDAKVGENCQTVRPVTVAVSTPPGQSFDLSNGGPLAGTYTIGRFESCGNALHLINDLVPGPGNTITLSLSDGVITSQSIARTVGR